MLILKMAFRNILRQKRRTLLTALMISGGFLLFSLSMGISEGTYGSIIEMFTRMHTGDIQIHKGGYLKRSSLYKTINNSDDLSASLKKMKFIKSFTPRVYSSALSFAGTKTGGAMIMGLNPAMEAESTSLALNIEGKFLPLKPSKKVLLGKGLADVLKVKLNDEISLIGQGADGSIANENFRIIGIMGGNGSSFGQRHCFMHIKDAQEFLALGTRIHEIAIVLNNHKEARKRAKDIKLLLNDESIDIDPWQIIEKEFYTAMLTDRKGANISNFIIMVIVLIGVLNTILMSILERTKEFGVMKAIGASPLDIFKLIMTEVIVLGAVSIFIGIMGSLAINYYLSIQGIPITPIAYGCIKFTQMISTVSAKVIFEPIYIFLMAIVVTGLYPALRAASILPIEALGDR
ncbi:MAG: FtsX-like permease family protein [Elusimicrobiota bacterium]|nr:FtsX-like permease family protein [Elusimicrobiota bacterium]